jgi:hypothetical protein
MCSVAALSLTVGMQAQQPASIEPQGRAPRALEARLVKGMPYSAEIATESVQTLADGNRIVRRTTGRVYRDGEGRVRREEDRPSGTPTVSITDPIARTTLTLDPATRTARASPTPVLGVIDASGDVKQYLIELFAVRETAGAQGLPQGQRPTPAAAGVGGARGGRGRSAGSGAIEEKLPDRFIEGVVATGIRRTSTIEKGEIGNEQPIRIVSEEWRSPDLQILVMTDLIDPRTGRTTYRLLNITRGEPDPALFQVPADYTLQSGRGGAPGGGAGGRGRIGRGGGRP